MTDVFDLDTLLPEPADLPVQSPGQDRLHEPWKFKRDAVIYALARHPADRVQRTAVRMARCGRWADLRVDPDVHQVRYQVDGCHARLCPYCGRARTARVAAEISAKIVGFTQPRHYVFTLASRDEDCRRTMSRLTKCLTALRQRPLWRANVRGGIAAIETTLNLHTDQFHVHAHAVVDADYVARAKLRPIWHAITGDSYVVWQQTIDTATAIAREIANYVVKPPALAYWPADKICQYAQAIYRRRMYTSFGTVYHAPPDEDPGPTANGINSFTVTIAQLHYWAERGDLPATRSLSLLPDLRADLDRIVPPSLPPAILEHPAIQAMDRRRHRRHDGPLFAQTGSRTPISREALQAKLADQLRLFHDRPDHGLIPNYVPTPEGNR